ncbi:MAG: hypothetical protein EBQ85_04125 [Proteobacteria bacterium]|nr:hypothetical protein [Pseudomonadota bacterium]
MEAVLVLLPICLAIFLLLEILRREVFYVVLGHASCLWGRNLALGETSQQARHRTGNFLKKALGESLGGEVFRHLSVDSFYVTHSADLHRLKAGDKSGGLLELYYRYPQLIQFEVRNSKKHHQEIINKCLFPF